jgi:hypothetical protein
MITVTIRECIGKPLSGPERVEELEKIGGIVKAKGQLPGVKRQMTRTLRVSALSLCLIVISLVAMVLTESMSGVVSRSLFATAILLGFVMMVALALFVLNAVYAMHLYEAIVADKDLDIAACMAGDRGILRHSSAEVF